jgi:hypothetical protein
MGLAVCSRRFACSQLYPSRVSETGFSVSKSASHQLSDKQVTTKRFCIRPISFNGHTIDPIEELVPQNTRNLALYWDGADRDRLTP